MSGGVFAEMENKVWPYRYRAKLVVEELHGGTPLDPKFVSAWLRSRLKGGDRLREVLNQTLREIGFDPYEDDPNLTPEENAQAWDNYMNSIVSEVEKKGLNGFKRDPETGELFIEGRQVKAMIKEAVNIRWPYTAPQGVGTEVTGKSNTWPGTKKAYKSVVSERMFVEDRRIPLGVKEPTGISTRFTVNRFGDRVITREEFLANAEIEVHIKTDIKWDFENWSKLWLTAQVQGLGASRSQDFGRFIVEEWEEVN